MRALQALSSNWWPHLSWTGDPTGRIRHRYSGTPGIWNADAFDTLTLGSTVQGRLRTREVVPHGRFGRIPGRPSRHSGPVRSLSAAGVDLPRGDAHASGHLGAIFDSARSPCFLAYNGARALPQLVPGRKNSSTNASMPASGFDTERLRQTPTPRRCDRPCPNTWPSVETNGANVGFDVSGDGLSR